MKNFLNVYGLLATAACVMAVANPAASQTQVEGQIDPGRVQERFRLDERPTIGGEPFLAPPATPESAAADVGPSFVLSGVSVEGATAFSAEELAPLYADMIGQQTTLGGAQNIANKITAYYRNAGYILSRAIVPPQNVSGGVIKIQMVEGYIDRVVFQGGDQQSQSVLEAYASGIKRSRPLNNAMLERYLLLMDDLTGATARAALSPSPTAAGASDLTITVDHDAFDGDVFVDNRGSRFLGSIQSGFRVASNSALGASERLQFRSVFASAFDELRYYEGTYEQTLGGEGTLARFIASYTETEPGNGLAPLDIEGESLSFSLAARHPFLRSRKENLFGNLGLRYRDSDSETLGSEQYDDNIRAVFVGVGYDILDGLQGVNRIDAELVQGLSFLGGNDSGDRTSRANAEDTFTRIEASYTRLQPIDANFSFFMGLRGQVAFDPLYASEEFAVGSLSYGSAYDPAEITGDSGMAGRLELRYSDVLAASWLDVYQLYAFYDGGKVWNKDVFVGESKDDSLTSTGIGTRIDFTEGWSGALEIAVPLTRDVAAEGSDGDDPRGFFSLTYSY